MSAENTKLRAQRMSPATRKEQILDAAVELIVSNGHSSCTLEQVAAAAGISKALIYKYFPKRDDLLKDILNREFEELRGPGLDHVPADIAPERIIHSTVEQALKYYFNRGPILRLLANDPAVADLVKRRNRDSRMSTFDYFVKKFMDSYGVPREVALIAVTMTINAPILSITPLRRRGIDADLMIEVWSDFIVGGWKVLKARHSIAKDRNPQTRKSRRKA
jgi:AcrR family transcriptional regulator